MKSATAIQRWNDKY